MPAWNFKARFADLVASGAKPHTIRAPRKDGRVSKVGEPAHLYTGMRTRECRKLHTGTVLAVTRIQIDAMFGRVILDGGSINYGGDRRSLSEAEIARLVKLDGFASDLDFFNWFEETHGDEFHGDLIEWAKAPELLP